MRMTMIERIQDGRATDVVVVGCSTAPLPQAFKEAVASAGAQLRGLNLREIEHRRPCIQPRSMACQRDLLLSAFVDPWSEDAAAQRTIEHLATTERDVVFGPLPGSMPPQKLWLQHDPR